MTATVVDPSGHQQAVIKGDTVPLQSLSVSYRKAYTAFSYGQAFDKNTISELIAAKLIGPENGAVNTVPEVLFIPGGVTLRQAVTRTKPTPLKRSPSSRGSSSEPLRSVAVNLGSVGALRSGAISVGTARHIAIRSADVCS
jgi:hypothetical protein